MAAVSLRNSAKLSVEVSNYYMSIEYGAFIVRNISDNGILITIFDAYGNSKRASYLMFQNCTSIDKLTFDTLFKKHVKNAHLMGRKYGSFSY